MRRDELKLYDYNDKLKSMVSYIEYMLIRTRQMFHYENLPDTIPANMLEEYLQLGGVAVITEVDGKLYAFTGGWGGEPDAYYRPTLFTVANPALKFNKTLKLGEEAVLIYNDSLYKGLRDMYRRYATALAENDLTMNIADILARVSALMVAGDDRSKQSAEKFLTDIRSGKLGVIGSNAVLDSFKSMPYTDAAHNSLTDLIELQQYLKASWFNELGLSSNYNMKREAINSAEAQMGEDSLLPLVDDMLHCREDWVAQVNALYGTDIRVSLHSGWKDVQEEESYEQAETDQGTAETETAEPVPEADTGTGTESPSEEPGEEGDGEVSEEVEVREDKAEEAADDEVIEVPVTDEEIEEAKGDE